MLFLAANAIGESHLNIGEAGLYALLGYAVVFLGLVLLMITDVLMEGTHLLYVGDDDIIRQAFSVTPKDSYAFLSRVMSRKKQIIPSLSALWG